jgi:hypothetical protein
VRHITVQRHRSTRAGADFTGSATGSGWRAIVADCADSHKQIRRRARNALSRRRLCQTGPLKSPASGLLQLPCHRDVNTTLNERGRQLRYSELVRSDQPSCGNLADRWPLVFALLAVGMGGPRSAPQPLPLGPLLPSCAKLQAETSIHGKKEDFEHGPNLDFSREAESVRRSPSSWNSDCDSASAEHRLDSVDSQKRTTAPTAMGKPR